MRYEIYKINDESIKIPIAESYMDCILLIKSDFYRILGKQVSTFFVIKKLFLPSRRSFLLWLRLSSYKGILYRFTKIMYEFSSRRVNIDIPPSTKIGYGLLTGHHMSIVINAGTIIGNNVNLSQFLNIGTNHNTPAIIGNNVYIGPQTCIVENVKIASYTTIGAGSIVTKDIPFKATVAGVPAKILNYNNPGRYVNLRYEFD